MANIADLIANRNQELEDFKQKKQEERTEAYERRDAAVMEVTSDPEKYRAFLDLHAQTKYNAANTATVWTVSYTHLDVYKRQLPVSELHDFPGHPFQVRDDEEMEKLAESITQHGVLMPGLVRPRAARCV